MTFKPTDVIPDGVGVMRTKNVQEQLELSDIVRVPERLIKRPEQYLQAGDTLVSSANSWYAVGRACWVPPLSEPLAVGGFVSALRPASPEIDARYLYRWFTSPRSQAVLRSLSNQTTNISNLNLRLAERIDVPLPPLQEQRRIAAILDKADEIRTKRREALAHLDALRQSVFESMFGLPGDARWERAALGDVVAAIENGTSPVCEARPADESEWGVLKLGAVTYGVFRAAENKALRGDPGRMVANEVRPGDVLMTRKNTRELVGAVAVVNDVRPQLLMPDLIFRLTLDADRLMPAYFQALMMHPLQRPAVRDLSSGSAASMPNISKARLRTLPLSVPPIDLQREFATRVAATETQRDAVERALAADDELFASLQSRAFRGDL